MEPKLGALKNPAQKAANKAWNAGFHCILEYSRVLYILFAEKV